MNFTSYFKKTIKLFEQAVPDIDYKTLIEMLEKDDVPRNVSTYLILIIPIAFTRIICGELNINFSDEYEEHLPDGKINKGFLSENDMYYKIRELSMDFIKNSQNKELLFKIAGVSPEFQVVNESLLKKMDVSKIKFSSLKIVL